MLLQGVKVAKRYFIFSRPTTFLTSMILAKMVWQAVKNSLTDLIFLKAIMIFILIVLFIGLIIKIYKTKQFISKCQTKIYILNVSHLF